MNGPTGQTSEASIVFMVYRQEAGFFFPSKFIDREVYRNGEWARPTASDYYTTYAMQFIGKSWANVSNAPFRKYTAQTLEGGIATPMIAHWPDGIEDAEREVRPREGSWKLYDLGKDPTELRDLSFEKPQALEKLKRRCEEWADLNQVLPWPVGK